MQKILDAADKEKELVSGGTRGLSLDISADDVAKMRELVRALPVAHDGKGCQCWGGCDDHCGACTGGCKGDD